MNLDIHELRGALELQHAISGAFFPLPKTETRNGVAYNKTDAHLPAGDALPSSITAPPMPENTPYTRIANLIPDDSPLHEMNTLDEVEEYLSTTILIPLDKTRKNPVMGTGNPNADLMIVGEAPGATEDATGEPFTGRAGKLLDKILAAIDFDRNDVYITNILKSRPPNNRDPRPDEVAAHVPMLYKQIALIRPVIMLCVGRTAGNTLLGRNGSLGSMRQTCHDFHGLPVIVTYHPAALLRNSQWKRPTWEDVQLLHSRFCELTTDLTDAI